MHTWSESIDTTAENVDSVPMKGKVAYAPTVVPVPEAILLMEV